MLYNYIKKWDNGTLDNVAIRHQDRTITYKELNILVNRVTNMLIDNGVKHGDRVGILQKKSIETVASFYAIMQCGASYVPVDVHGPAERTKNILNGCNINTVFADSTGIEVLTRNANMFDGIKTIIYNDFVNSKSINETKFKIVNIKDCLSYSADYEKKANCNPDDTAYVLHTSGSTGYPKGVTLTHMNGSVFVEWAAKWLKLNDKDIFSSHAPFTFDLSIFDIFCAHYVGATLCLPPENITFFPDSLLDYISENKITVWYSVPSVLINLLKNYKECMQNKMNSIKTLIYAGEVFQYNYLNEFCKVIQGARLINFYGPTETNVITYYSVDTNSELTENVSIGKACPYANIYIIDESGKIVPSGEKGELAVNGDSLMLGYWNDSVKTDSVIREIIIGERKEKLYFTGDIVFEDSEGNLRYSGRKDNMVKIRGFRVELGEIEKTILDHPGVQNVVVVPKADNDISNRIFAFVEFKDGFGDIDELYSFCSDKLPSYMLPEKIILQDKFPLTVNGKIDRKKLMEECIYSIA